MILPITHVFLRYSGFKQFALFGFEPSLEVALKFNNMWGLDQSWKVFFQLLQLSHEFIVPLQALNCLEIFVGVFGQLLSCFSDWAFLRKMLMIPLKTQQQRKLAKYLLLKNCRLIAHLHPLKK